MMLMNLPANQIQIQKTDLWLPREMGHGGGVEWEFGIQFSHSVASDSLQPMDCSTPGFPVHYQLLEPTQTHVHTVGDAIQPSHPLSSPSPPTFNLSQHQPFPVSQFFASDGQSIGVSVSSSVLPLNIQG